MTLFAETPDVRIAYEESGPAHGVPVILAHGYPDDVRTWDGIAPGLAAAGFRVLCPFTRGYGETRLRDGVMRSGEIAALGRDVLAFADALGIHEFHLVGHDWGGRAGYACAVFAPERMLSLTVLAVVYAPYAAREPLTLEQTARYWYQWYFATPRGAEEVRERRVPLARDLWRRWSPALPRDDAFEATARSFDNPDHADIVLHSYRSRWGFAEGDPAYAVDRAMLADPPPIGVATHVLLGADDGVTDPAGLDGAAKYFSGIYTDAVMPGVGHFMQRERPEVILAAIREGVLR